MFCGFRCQTSGTCVGTTLASWLKNVKDGSRTMSQNLFWYLPATFFNVLAKVHSQHLDYCKSDLSNESGGGWFYFCSSRLLNAWLYMWNGQWVSIEYDTFFLWTILNFMIFVMIFEWFQHENVYFCCLKSALAEIYKM